VTPGLTSVAIVAGLLIVLGVGSRVQAMGVTRDWFPAWVGRKMAHIGFGASTLLCWALFPESPSARWFAAVPPMVIGLYFAAVALGWISDRGTVMGGSRSGSPSGLLKGPVLYAAAFVVLTLLAFRGSPVGMAALAFMTFGDAMAEVVGRAVRSPKLPWSPNKTVAGSVGAFVFGWTGGVGGLWLLIAGGWIAGAPSTYFAPVALVALAGTAVESLPFAEIDNVTVPMVCAGVGVLVFG
jgi:phytol kinase